MKRRDDIYNVGNDYDQKVSAYFVTEDTEAEKQKGAFPGYKAYSDGLYHFTTKPVYELSGGEFALNKRIFNKLPQSEWQAPDFPGASAFSAINAASAVFSPDYATVEYETDNTWSGTPAANK